MAMVFRSVDLFVLSYLLVTVGSHTGEVLPPRNVSLRWINNFEPWLTWAPPEHSMENCNYEVNSSTIEKTSVTWDEGPPPWSEYVVMDGGSLRLTVNTVCGVNRSEPVVFNITDPELVRDLQCSIHTSKHTHCSWEPAGDARDLRFFYKLVDESRNRDHDSSAPLQACSSYRLRDDVRIGCDLQARINDDVHIVFNGTWNNKLVTNTFKVELKVRPPPPEWTVKKTPEKFLINWSCPDIIDLSAWEFDINYTECSDTKVINAKREASTEIVRVSHCQYRMKIKATLIATKESTEWSSEKYFGADPNVMVYVVAVIVPLMIAGLAALTLVCYRKNKDTIFPKVPEPRDFLSSISDNNNKNTVRNMYIPVEEEHSCKISLVIEPQNS